MEFVVLLLEQVFSKSPAAATELMLQIHPQGDGRRGRVRARGRGDEGRDGAPARGAARLSAARGHGEGVRSVGGDRTRVAVDDPGRAARGDGPRARLRDRRAPALRAPARRARQGGPAALRRRSRAARTLAAAFLRRRGRAARRPEGADAPDDGLPPRDPARDRTTPPAPRRTSPSRSGDLLAAIFQEPDAHSIDAACAPRASRASTCSATSAHGDLEARRWRRAITGRRGHPCARPDPRWRSRSGAGVPADPLAAFATNLTERAPPKGKLDPLIGRSRRARPRGPHPRPPPQEQPDLRRRDRRREDGARRRPRAPHRHEGRSSRRSSSSTEIFSLDHRRAARRHALPRRLRGPLQGAPPRRCGQRPKRFILFIDEIHTILGAGCRVRARHDRRVEPAQAAASPSGDAALHGLDDLSASTAISSATAPSRGASRKSTSHEPSPEEMRAASSKASRPRYEAHHKRPLHEAPAI